MTTAEKLAQLKTFLKITGAEMDADLTAFLAFAKSEILSWLYFGKVPSEVVDVPAMYEPTQIMAVVAGYGLLGVENQTASTENTITRQFKHSSMIEFIRANVIPYAQVV